MALRTAAAVATATVAAVLLLAAAAWACVPQPLLVTVQPGLSGPAGSQVSVAAVGFDGGRAEIRWNALDGELLGTAEGPDFSAGVTIPPVPPGMYHVVVLGRAPGGELGNTRTVPFMVTAEGRAVAGAAAPPDPWPESADAAGQSPRRTSTPAGRSALLMATGAGLAALGGLAGILVSRGRAGRERDGT